MYKPTYSKRFIKHLQSIPQKEQIKILQKITDSLENPLQVSVKLETTKPPIYRLRAGDYRIFFELDRELKIMIVTEVKRRTTQTYH